MAFNKDNLNHACTVTVNGVTTDKQRI